MSKRVADLRALAKELGLSSSGIKMTLTTRIMEWQAEKNKGNKKENKKQSPVRNPLQSRRLATSVTPDVRPELRPVRSALRLRAKPNYNVKDKYRKMGLSVSESVAPSRPQSEQNSMLRDAMGDPPARNESEYVAADNMMIRRDRSMSRMPGDRPQHQREMSMFRRSRTESRAMSPGREAMNKKLASLKRMQEDKERKPKEPPKKPEPKPEVDIEDDLLDLLDFGAVTSYEDYQRRIREAYMPKYKDYVEDYIDDFKQEVPNEFKIPPKRPKPPPPQQEEKEEEPLDSPEPPPRPPKPPKPRNPSMSLLRPLSDGEMSTDMEGRIADTSVEPLIVTDPADLLRPELRNVVMYETDTDAEAFGVGALGEDMMGELPENEGVVPPFAPQPTNFRIPGRSLNAHEERPFTFAGMPPAPIEETIAPQKDAFGVGALEEEEDDLFGDVLIYLSDEEEPKKPKREPTPDSSDETDYDSADDIVIARYSSKPKPKKPKVIKRIREAPPEKKPIGRKHPRRKRAKQRGYRPVVRPRRVILGGKKGNPARAQAPRVQRGMARNPIMAQIDNEANYYYEQSFVPRYKKDDMAVMYPWLFGEEGLYSEIECEWPCRTVNGKCVCPE